jgi:hypothetical protein
VLEVRYEEQHAMVTAHVPAQLEQKLAPFAAA